MKKLLIVIIILLMVLALGQLIYYKTNNTVKSDKDTFLYIIGATTLYDRYNPKLDLIELGNVFYDFAVVDVPKIYEDVISRDNKLLEKYYKQNQKEIKKMNILRKILLKYLSKYKKYMIMTKMQLYTIIKLIRKQLHTRKIIL